MVFLFIHPLREQVLLYRRHFPPEVLVEHAFDISFLHTADCRTLLLSAPKPLVCLQAEGDDIDFFARLQRVRRTYPETRFSVLAKNLHTAFLDQCAAAGVSQCIDYLQYRPRQVAELLYTTHLVS